MNYAPSKPSQYLIDEQPFTPTQLRNPNAY